MKLLVKKGKTSKRVFLFIQDNSKTTGVGLTGLTNASANLVCYRSRDDDGNAGATQLSLVAGTRGTWSSGGFVEKDSTNQPGVYELGLDNAGLVTGSDQVVYYLFGNASLNMAPCVLEIQLVDWDPQAANLPAQVNAYLAGQDPATLVLGAGVPGTYAAGSAGAALGRIASGVMTVVSPVTQGGTVTLVAGDDYSNTDGRAITFTDASGPWPDITGATIKVYVNNVLFTTGTVVLHGTPGSQSVRMEPTAAQTFTLTPGNSYLYDVRATLASGRFDTLARGLLLVLL